MPIVEKLAEPFFFPGRDVGCLLVHGFTGSPSEMRYLGTYLANHGYTVMGVLLAGHGTTAEEMAVTTWPEWYASVEQAYQELRKCCSRIFILGLSMGGLLTLHASLNCPATGVVAINSPIFVQDKKILLASVLKYFYPYAKKQGFTPIEGHFTYDKMPLRCVDSLLTLIRIVRKELPSLTAPLLVLQSDQDKTVDPRSADYIVQTAGAVDKQLTRFPKSGHLLTIGVERELVAKRVLEFIETTLAKESSLKNAEKLRSGILKM